MLSTANFVLFSLYQILVREIIYKMEEVHNVQQGHGCCHPQSHQPSVPHVVHKTDLIVLVFHPQPCHTYLPLYSGHFCFSHSSLYRQDISDVQIQTGYSQSTDIGSQTISSTQIQTARLFPVLRYRQLDYFQCINIDSQIVLSAQIQTARLFPVHRYRQLDCFQCIDIDSQTFASAQIQTARLFPVQRYRQLDYFQYRDIDSQTAIPVHRYRQLDFCHCMDTDSQTFATAQIQTARLLPLHRYRQLDCSQCIQAARLFPVQRYRQLDCFQCRYTDSQTVPSAQIQTARLFPLQRFIGRLLPVYKYRQM